MITVTQDPQTQPARKQLRVGHQSERGGINAVRALLEHHGMVVDEVDGRSDYGRDLNVDVTTGTQVTGGIIGVQVKGGRSFFRHGSWVIPAKPVDWEYWRSSTVPIIGMIHDPDTGEIRWRNLTHLARSRVLGNDDSYEALEQSDDLPEVELVDVLNDLTFQAFRDHVEAYLSATSDSAFLLLLDGDDEVRRRGVFHCWTLGRRDPKSLVLLRRLLPGLDGRSLVDGIHVLAHATAHPDIYWTARNWIPPLVEAEVQQSFRWTPDEMVALVHKIETIDEVGADWQRGGVGQSLWSIMVADPKLCAKLPRAIHSAAEDGRVQTAVRLLVCFQYLTPEPVTDVDALLDQNPALRDDEMAAWIVEELRTRGRFPVY